MRSLLTLGECVVPIKVSKGGFITERGPIEVLGEDPRHYPPLFALAVNPAMLDYLIEELPWDDGFTRELIEMRDEAKQTLWERNV